MKKKDDVKFIANIVGFANPNERVGQELFWWTWERSEKMFNCEKKNLRIT